MAVRDDAAVDQEAEKLKSFDDFDLRLGDIMRGERATLGKSLLDVQRDLKIKAAYIAAIENSDPSAFETQGFVAGYVRSYARYLGMDPEEAYQIFCEESGFQAASGITSPGGKSQSSAAERRAKAADPLMASRTPYLPEVAGRFTEFDPRAAASLAVLVVLIGGIGWGAWSVLQEIQRVNLAPVAQTPGVTSTVDPLSNVAAVDVNLDVPFAGEAPSAAALDRLYQPRALDLPVLVERDGPIGAVDPSKVGALAQFESKPVIETAPAIETASAEAAPSEVVEDASVQVVEDTPPEVVLFAVRAAWVRVQSSDGTVLFEKILDAGERYQVPLSENPAVLRAGNSGSVYFEIDGEAFGPAGPGASVAKNVVLGHEDLLQAYAVADLEADPELKRIVELAEQAAATTE